ELINDARLDPLGNAARYISAYTGGPEPTIPDSKDSDIDFALKFFNVKGSTLEAASKALVPVEPLAWNDSLASAAHDHSQEMINQDKQAHNLPGEDPLGTRFSKHGYAWDTNPFGGIGENIYAFSNSMLFAHAGFMVDWGFPGPGVVDGMQAPPGHRDNIMDAD